MMTFGVRGAMLFAACVLTALGGGTVRAQTGGVTMNAAPVAPATTWPTRDGVFDIANFRFKDGSTLPTLHLHYLTLGTPHRGAD